MSDTEEATLNIQPCSHEPSLNRTLRFHEPSSNVITEDAATSSSSTTEDNTSSATEDTASSSYLITEEELDAFDESISAEAPALRFCVQCGQNNTTTTSKCLVCAPLKGCRLCKTPLDEQWRTLCKQCFIFCSEVASITKGMITKDIEPNKLTLPPRQCNTCYTDFIPLYSNAYACRQCYAKRQRQ